MTKILTTLSLLFFLLTFPITILWNAYAVKAIYLVSSLPQVNLTQATDVLNNIRQPGLTSDEISHLQDVLILVRYSQIIFLISLISCILLWLHHRDTQIIYRTSKFLLILIPCLLAFFILAWNFAFGLFHQLLFPQGNWAFPADSLLITLFPEIFWQLAFLAYFLLILLLCLFTWLIARHFTLKSHPLQLSLAHPENV